MGGDRRGRAGPRDAGVGARRRGPSRCRRATCPAGSTRRRRRPCRSRSSSSRAVRRGQEQRRAGARGPRLVRRRQPAPGAAAADGAHSAPGVTSAGSPRSSTSEPGVLQRPAGGDPGPRRGRPPAARMSTCTPATRCWSAATSRTAASTRCRATGPIDGIAASAACSPVSPARPTSGSTPATSTSTSCAGRWRTPFARDGRPAAPATVLSFGFKYGLPLDADLVVDARFLPNPHWFPELRPKTGQDPDVRDYVLASPTPRSSSTATSTSSGCSSRLPARGQAVPDARRGLHRRQAPQRRHRRGVRRRLRRRASTAVARHRDLGRE